MAQPAPPPSPAPPAPPDAPGTTTADPLPAPEQHAGDPEVTVLTPPAAAPAPASLPEPDATQQGVIDQLGDVTRADGRRYAAIDDRALPLDGLKIIESSPGAYVGIYHSLDAGEFRLKVATSRDLLNWRWRADLDTGAAQGAIAKAADGSYVVAYEHSTPGRVQLRFRSYDSLDKLLAGAFSREFTAPLTLAPTAEGTPNIESADAHRITVGFHDYRDADVDRQAQGTLTDFSTWSASAAPALDDLFAPFQVKGNIGDRDWFELDGHAYALQEAQTTKNDWGSWRTYLVDRESNAAFPLEMKTAGGSRAFGNPTATVVTAPDGEPAIVVTQYVFSEAAAPAEAGSLIYFKHLL
jgi:hypothetical protein